MKNNLEKVLVEYEKRASQITQEMYTIVARAQRMSDDKKYREILKKISKE